MSCKASLGAVLAIVLFLRVGFGAEGPVAQYRFDEGSGETGLDTSGNANHGRIHGAEFVPCGKGYALRFDGQADYVDCGASEDLGLTESLTVAAWVKVDQDFGQGEPGIVGKAPRVHQTFGLTCFSGAFFFYVNHSGNQCAAPIVKGEWVHLAGTFDAKSGDMRLYADGKLAGTSVARDGQGKEILHAVNSGGNLLIGRNGDAFFPGMIDQVKLWARALSPKEVCEEYLAGGAEKGMDMSRFGKIQLTPRFRLTEGRVLIESDVSWLPQSPARFQVEIFAQEKDEAVFRQEMDVSGDAGNVRGLLDVSGLLLAPQLCELRVTALDPQGAAVGEQAAHPFRWPMLRNWLESLPHVKVLNSFVIELLNAKDVRPRRLPLARPRTLEFFNPRNGWLFIRSVVAEGSRGSVWVCLDSDSRGDAVIAHEGADEPAREAMRFLQKGTHQLTILGRGKLEGLIVRAIPELQYAKYKRDPYLASYGEYDWPYLEKHVLPHVNTIIMQMSYYDEALMRNWKDQGKRWIVEYGVPGAAPAPPPTPEEAYQYWTQCPGFQNPLLDGLIADEIGSYWPQRHEAWTEAVREIASDPQWNARQFYVYGGGDALQWPATRKWVETLMQAGYKFTGGGMYVKEFPTEREFDEGVLTFMRKNALDWLERYPNAMESFLLHLGYFSTAGESLNYHPSVDYKVCMDKTLHFLANEPTSLGAFGLHWYTSRYADEENIRWAYRLFRHYCIEGKTERLSQDPYLLPHLANPDFEEGPSGWELHPAEEGSISVRKLEIFSYLVGRYERNIGDSFLVMKRSDKAPNRFVQTLRNLRPGHTYSLKMITADYQDIVAGTSEKKEHGLTIDLGAAERAPDKCFRETFKSDPAHQALGFGGDKPAYITWHFVGFRPNGAPVRLEVSDWTTDDGGPPRPAGPVGQELMVDFIEIQPYWTD